MVRTIRIANSEIGIAVQTAALRRGTRITANELRRVERETQRAQRAIRNLNRRFTSFISSTLTLRNAIGVLAGGGVMGAFIRQAAAAGSSLQEAADRAGLAVEQYQVLARTFETNGIAIEEFNKTLTRIAETSLDVANGGQTYADIYRQLGVNVLETNGAQRENHAILLDLVDGFSRLTNQSQRAGLAQRLFGEGGIALLNTFQNGRQVFEETSDQMRRLGVLSEEQVRSLKDLQQSFTDTANAIRTQFGRAVADSADELIEINDALRNFSSRFLPAAVDVVKLLAQNLGIITDIAIVIAVSNLLKTISQAIISFEDLSAATNILQAGLVRLSTTALTLVGPAAGIVLAGKLWFDAAEAADRFERAVSGVNTSLREQKEVLESLERGSFGARVAPTLENNPFAQGYRNLADRMGLDPDGAAAAGAAAIAQDIATLQSTIAIQEFDEQTQRELTRFRRRNRLYQAQQQAFLNERNAQEAVVNLEQAQALADTEQQFQEESERSLQRSLDRRHQAYLNYAKQVSDLTMNQARLEQIALDTANFGQEEFNKEQLRRQQERIDAEEKRLERVAVIQDEYVRLEERRTAAAARYAQVVSNGLITAVQGAQSLSEVFKELTRSIVADLLRIAITEQLTTIFSGFAARGLPRNASGRQLTPYNQGTELQAGGYIGSDRFARVGEAGPETVLLPGGSRVLPAGVGAGGGTTYNFNINGSDTAQVNSAIQAWIPTIESLTLNRVAVEANQPGGFRTALRGR